MKHLIGLLFCLGFLLFAGTADAQAQTEQTIVTTCQTPYPDIGESDVNITNVQDIPVFEKGIPQITNTVNSILLSELQKGDALCYRYSLVPECPVIYVKQKAGGYIYYSSSYYMRYMNPPNQSHFNI